MAEKVYLILRSVRKDASRRTHHRRSQSSDRPLSGPIRSGSDQAFLARPSQRVVERAPDLRQELVDLALGGNERRAEIDDIAEAAGDDAVDEGTLGDMRRDGIGRREILPARLVLDELEP